MLNWLYADTIPAAVRVGKVIRFRETDVMESLEKAKKQAGVEAKLPGLDLVRYALWLVAADAAEAPPWLLVRDATEEDQEAARLALVYWKEMEDLETTEARRAFCQGVVDAAFIDEQEG